MSLNIKKSGLIILILTALTSCNLTGSKTGKSKYEQYREPIEERIRFLLTCHIRYKYNIDRYDLTGVKLYKTDNDFIEYIVEYCINNASNHGNEIKTLKYYLSEVLDASSQDFYNPDHHKRYLVEYMCKTYENITPLLTDPIIRDTTEWQETYTVKDQNTGITFTVNFETDKETGQIQYNIKDEKTSLEQFMKAEDYQYIHFYINMK
jgi:hypothetical protein